MNLLYTLKLRNTLSHKTLVITLYLGELQFKNSCDHWNLLFVINLIIIYYLLKRNSAGLKFFRNFHLFVKRKHGHNQIKLLKKSYKKFDKLGSTFPYFFDLGF